MAATLDGIVHDLQRIKADAQRDGGAKRPLWPMIVLRSPKGWTCPKEIDGKRTEDYWRSHQVPMGDMNKPEHIKILEAWMKSYKPEELFDVERPPESGDPGVGAQGRAAHERQSARQRRPAAARPAPAGFSRLRREGEGARRVAGRVHASHGRIPARHAEAQRGQPQLSPVQPGREQLQPLAGRARGHEPRMDGGALSVRRSPGARWPGHGDAERAPDAGLARGLSADRPARILLVLRGVHPHHRFDVQPARQVAQGVQPHPLAAARSHRSTTCFPRMSGARITTASATRTRASSIMS